MAASISRICQDLIVTAVQICAGSGSPRRKLKALRHHADDVAFQTIEVRLPPDDIGITGKKRFASCHRKISATHLRSGYNRPFVKSTALGLASTPSVSRSPPLTYAAVTRTGCVFPARFAPPVIHRIE